MLLANSHDGTFVFTGTAGPICALCVKKNTKHVYCCQLFCTTLCISTYIVVRQRRPATVEASCKNYDIRCITYIVVFFTSSFEFLLVRFILVNVMSVVPGLFRRQVHARIVHASAAQVVFMALAMNVVVRLLNFISIHTKFDVYIIHRCFFYQCNVVYSASVRHSFGLLLGWLL